ncbi:MAG: hypothetical protein U1E77_12395 [Inhella sp.]
MLPLKRCATVQTGIAKGKDNEGKDTVAVSYLRVANVQDGHLRLDDVAVIDVPLDALARYQLQHGDVLMNEGGDADKLGRGCIWRGEIAECIHQNHVFAVRPHAVSSEWLNWVTGSAYAQFYFMSRSKQSTNLASISSNNIMDLPLVLPPPAEQTTVVAFLDRETAKIDALIAEQEKLIALLAEKRQATISHAVTRGLNPNAPMKDSGVPWLGEAPAHWDIRALRRVIAGIEQGWSPECHAREADPNEWGVLKAGCLNGGVFRPLENKALPPDLSPESKYEVLVGDVLMSRASGSPELVGSTALVTATRSGLMLSDKIFRLRLQDDMQPRYFVAAMGSVALRAQIENALSGGNGMANNLPQSSLLSFVMTVPPLGEQEAVAEFIEQELGRLDGLSVESERAIALLKERRSALIAAAVTGQIDVRGAVAA